MTAHSRDGLGQPAPLDRLALLPVLGIVAAILGGPVQSGDLWWHVRVGDWLRANLALPWRDPFSHTAGDDLYVPQEYGSQVLFSLVDSIGGVGALKVFGVLLGVALILVFEKIARRRVGPSWAAALAAVFAAAYAIKWELRPHLLSSMVLLWMLDRLFPPTPQANSGPSARTTLVLALVTVVWVQLHAEAVFAPMFCALGAIAAAAGALYDRAVLGQRPGFGPLGRWLAATAATGVASFASPLGWWPHRYALFKREIPKLYIDEWFPAWIAPSDPRFMPLDGRLAVLLLVLLALAGVAIADGARARRAPSGLRRGPSWERLALLAACVFFALTARRYLWLLSLPLVDLLLSARTAAAQGASGFGARLGRSRSAPRAIAVLAALPLGLSHFAANTTDAFLEGRYTEAADRRLFPVHAAALLAECGPAGNLFHPYDWGGYLLYVLGEDNPIFVDGRTTLFERIIPERWRAERDPDYARQVFAARDVRAIVARRLILGTNPPAAYRPPDADVGWVRVHADALAELWIRSDQTDALARYSAWYAQQGVPFDPDRGFVELAAWIARPEWQSERDLVPASVAKHLAPAVAAARDAGAGDASNNDPAPWLELARAADERRMGRNARWALARYLHARSLREPGFDPRPYLERLDREPPRALIENLSPRAAGPARGQD